MCLVQQIMWETSVSLFQFHRKSKTVLKIKSVKNGGGEVNVASTLGFGF